MKNLLKKQFIGTGEVKGFKFNQIRCSSTAYLYEITSSNSKVYYEVFLRKTVPMCIDFKKRIYSETESKEIYPKSKSFGVWAWTYNDFELATKKFNQL